jgi:pimeloyl-ACP methyl ester carboxylesterase
VDAEGLSRPAPIPVVVIHGALRSRVGLWPVVRYLRARGFQAAAFGYATRRDDLERHAERLEAFIAAWLGGQKVPTLGLLTHSMGGLVARAYLARPGAAAQAERQRVAMLAPPNQGAVLAARLRPFPPFRWLYGAAAEVLQPERVAALPPPPGSAELLILAGGKREGERGYSRWIPGNNDGLVGVAETALPGVDPVLVGGAHSVLQWRPAVLARAAEFLAGAERSVERSVSESMSS